MYCMPSKLHTGLLVGLLLSTPGLSAAAAPVHEWNTPEASRALVEQASRGDVKEAFATAQQLRYSRDEPFSKRLDHELEVAQTQFADLGERQGAIIQVGELRIGECVQRDYRVRFANGEQRWTVKFRRSSEGWNLTELHVATLLASGA